MFQSRQRLQSHPHQKNMTIDEHNYLWNRRYQIKLRVLANRIYQQERHRRFEFREGLVKALSIIAGSIAFANIAENDSILKWCLFIITSLNIFSLVFSYGAKARDASARANDWAMLEKEIDAIGERDFTESHLNNWSASCNEIEASEPAMQETLFKICSKRATDALGGEDDYNPCLCDHIKSYFFIP